MTSPSQMTINEILIMGSDPCEVRHGGNENSIAAHAKVKPTKLQTYGKIMDLLYQRGDYGATVHEISGALGFGAAINRASGRLSELKKMKWIKENGEKRHGAAVLVVCGVKG
jgi:hypothetical protein